MTESSNESFKPYQVAFDAYRKDIDQVCAISERLVASAEGIDNDPIKDTEKLEKLKTIKSQMLKLRETRNEARNRYDAPRSTRRTRRAFRISEDSVPMPREPGSPAPGFAIFSRNARLSTPPKARLSFAVLCTDRLLM